MQSDALGRFLTLVKKQHAEDADLLPAAFRRNSSIHKTWQEICVLFRTEDFLQSSIDGRRKLCNLLPPLSDLK